MRKYLANRKKNLRLEWAKARATSAEILKVLLKVGRAVKIFYGQGTLFIGEEGALSRTGLDSTVARFMEDVCPLRRSEGDVFYQSSLVFVETDRRSQPASPRG
jgi:hypothetical protein